MDLRMKLSVPTWWQTFSVVATLALGLVCLTGSEFRRAILQVKRAVCMEDAALIREAINQYTLDKNQPPKSLRDLVDEHYLSEIPKYACMEELDSPPVLEDPVLTPNRSAFKLTSLN